MATDTRTTKLIINDLTKEQYESIANPSDTELYLVPDDTDDKLALKQDKTDNDLATVSKTVVGAINELDTKVEEIEAARFVDATIVGEPNILQGQVSGFSTVSYLQFPMVLDLHDQAFDIYMCFTTENNVQTQQNILDSKFGIGLAIMNGKGVMSISSNGTSWDIGSATGTINIESNTTYYAKLSWNKLQYKTFLSTDGVNYTQDMVLTGAVRPFPTTIYIGGCNNTETGHTPHPFLGTINMNKARVDVMGVTIWQGMGDIGLATRADVSLDNLDARGEARFTAKQDKATYDVLNEELILP